MSPQATSKLFGSLWFGWLALFGVIEYLGFKAGDQTLTAWVRWATHHPVAKYPFAAFLIWLFAHFIFGVNA